MGRRCLVTDRYSQKAKTVQGLNLVDYSVKAHYSPLKDALLRKLSQDERVYAIPQASALIDENGDISCIGEVFLFEKGNKIPLPSPAT